MNVQIAIVDDQLVDREILEQAVRRYFHGRKDIRAEVTSFQDAESFLAAFEPGKIDLALLDIYMKNMNGIELAKRIREQDAKILLVFATSSTEHAFEAFPLHPFDYIVKPFAVQQIYVVLSEALRTLSVEDPEIQIKAPRTTYDVPVRTIYAVLSQGHSVELRLDGGRSIRSIMTFGEISELLQKEDRFLLCNRGVLINMDHVLKFDADAVQLVDGSSYPLRTRGRSQLAAQYAQYVMKNAAERK